MQQQPNAYIAKRSLSRYGSPLRRESKQKKMPEQRRSALNLSLTDSDDEEEVQQESNPKNSGVLFRSGNALRHKVRQTVCINQKKRAEHFRLKNISQHSTETHMNESTEPKPVREVSSFGEIPQVMFDDDTKLKISLGLTDSDDE